MHETAARDGGVLLCTSGFNPIDVEAASSSWRTSLDPFNPMDVLVEDALVGSAPDTGDTVEAFTDFIDRLLTQVDSSPSGAPSCPHTREGRAFLGLGSRVRPRLSRACLATRPMALAFVLALRLAQGALAR